MIEVERKFNVSQEQLDSIKADSQRIETIFIHDQYYDYADLSLIKSGRWLRNRNNHWELKISKNSHFEERKADVHEEIENENEIKHLLDIPDFNAYLQAGRLTRLHNLETTRTYYQKKPFNIDFDEVFSPDDDFHYKILEIEIMVHENSEINDATSQILNFATNYNLDLKKPRGKNIEYFYQKKRKIYNLLQEIWLKNKES